MEYRTKIKFAEKIAAQLEEQKSIDAIKSDLKSEGLYENDITNILVSARKILGEKYQPKVKEFLLENKEIHGAKEFSLLGSEVIDILIGRASQDLALQEKKNITKLIKEGQTAEQVFTQVDTRFISEEKAAQHIHRIQEIKTQNSGSGRMLNIGGGIGLIVLTGVIAVTTGRLFYVIPIIGLGMIAKGIITEEMK